MSLPRFFIYALLDPDTYEIKYVGQSAQGISRFNFTMNKISLMIDSPKTKWILELLNKNKIPLFKIVEVCEFQELNQKEVFWISKYRNLLNIASGGVGGNTGKAHQKWKPVVAKNLQTGHITEYEYVWQVEKDGFYPTKVSAVCLGKRKSHKGHYFVHKGDSFNEKEMNNPFYDTKKSVKRIEIKTGEIKIFDSINLASKNSNVCIATVSNSCRGKSKSRKYNFEYLKCKPCK